MFTMLNGRWPPGPGDDPGRPHPVGERVADAVRAQVEAGMDLVTDGLVRWADPSGELRAALEHGDTGADGMVVRAWAETAAFAAGTGATVAAVLPGPVTMARSGDDTGDPVALAGALAGELAALQAAGCPLVVVDEPAAVDIGSDERRRGVFRDAHRALLAAAPSLHAMLAISGGSAWDAGPETILDAPYHSYLLDLIGGPDNWYLVRASPGDRGIVCGALRAPARDDQAPLLVWAARYAASANGRGLERVGLTNGSSLAGLDPGDAAAALVALSRGARLAALEPEQAIAAGLDRRTFSQPSGRGARRGGLPRT